MTHRPLPDLAALAANLRLMALGLLVEVLELIGLGALTAGLRRRMGLELSQLERFAAGIVVLTALRTQPQMPAQDRAGRRPLAAPRGFARVALPDRAMRAMQRKLFPKLRDLRQRLARFDAVLDDVARAAARLARHIARIPPASRLALLSGTAGFQPAMTLAGWKPAVPDDDSS